jgi:hypothetical protein
LYSFVQVTNIVAPLSTVPLEFAIANIFQPSGNVVSETEYVGLSPFQVIVGEVQVSFGLIVVFITFVPFTMLSPSHSNVPEIFVVNENSTLLSTPILSSVTISFLIAICPLFSSESFVITIFICLPFSSLPDLLSMLINFHPSGIFISSTSYVGASVPFSQT